MTLVQVRFALATFDHLGHRMRSLSIFLATVTCYSYQIHVHVLVEGFVFLGTRYLHGAFLILCFAPLLLIYGLSKKRNEG